MSSEKNILINISNVNGIGSFVQGFLQNGNDIVFYLYTGDQTRILIMNLLRDGIVYTEEIHGYTHTHNQV